MNPELAFLLVAGLAALGRRRRRRAGSATTGQRLALTGRAASKSSAQLVRWLGSSGIPGAVCGAEATVAAATVAAAWAARMGGQATSAIVAAGVEGMGRLAAGGAGLVVDGVLGVRDGLSAAARAGASAPVRAGAPALTKGPAPHRLS
jgi:hypothetical protein